MTPTLFNVYIDTLVAELSKTPLKLTEIPANIFCDDVLLMAQDAKGLQALLNTCSGWAACHRMTLDAHKCTAILPPTEICTVITIAGQKLPEAASTEYLSMKIRQDGSPVQTDRSTAGWARLRER